jgi:hypothetical protein
MDVPGFSQNMKKSKNQKKNNKHRKKVDEFVHFKATANNDGFINIGFDEMGRLDCPEADKSSVCVYKGYMRDSGKEKVISKTFSFEGMAYRSQRDHIINNFDSIAAIDTNDFKFSGRNLSISASFFCEKLKKSASTLVEALPMPFFIIENIQPGLNSEIVGWYLFIKHIVPLLKLTKASKLALVVDSELGKHQAINCRESPYYREHLLPENIGLIYASTDTGTDLPNNLIKECDRNSRKLYNQIQTGELLIPNNFGGESIDFSGYAYVNHEESEYKIK